MLQGWDLCNPREHQGNNSASNITQVGHCQECCPNQEAHIYTSAAPVHHHREHTSSIGNAYTNDRCMQAYQAFAGWQLPAM